MKQYKALGFHSEAPFTPTGPGTHSDPQTPLGDQEDNAGEGRSWGQGLVRDPLRREGLRVRGSTQGGVRACVKSLPEDLSACTRHCALTVRDAASPQERKPGSGRTGRGGFTAHGFPGEGGQDSGGYHRAPLLTCSCAPCSEPPV